MGKTSTEVKEVLKKYLNGNGNYDFSDCDLTNGDFVGWDFSDANFSNANFRYADFSDADFNDAKFLGADFTSSTARVYMQMVNTTRHNNMIYYFPTLKIFSTGCFTGSEETLMERVRTTHKNNKHLHDRYMRVISNLKIEYQADEIKKD